MRSYIAQSEQSNDYRNYKPPTEFFKPTPTNIFNEKYLHEGPSGLRRDYDSMYKALEYTTLKQLDNMEVAKQDQAEEVQYYRDENLKFQEYFDKVLNDNKVLYLRCKELEQYLAESNPALKQQYQTITQENEELRRHNYQLMNDQAALHKDSLPLGSTQPADIALAHRSQQSLLTLQREADELKRANYEMKMKLQAQFQHQGQPFSRSQLSPPNPSLQVSTSQRNFSHSAMPPAVAISRGSGGGGGGGGGGYANRQYFSDDNQAVLDRCRYIVQSNNYF